MEESSVETSPPRKISRKRFLQITGAAIGSALVGASWWANWWAKERRAEKPDSLAIDITKSSFDANFESYGIPQVPEEQLAQRLGVGLPLTAEKLTRTVPEDESLQLAVLGQILKIHYVGHGEKVANAMKQVDKILGVPRPEPRLESLRAGMLKSFEIKKDEIGNPTFWFELDPERLAQIIGKASERFVNLSLELGKVGITFKIFTTERANPDTIDPTKVKQLKLKIVKTEEGEQISEAVYQLPDGTQIGQEEYDKLWEEYSRIKIVPREEIYFTLIDAYGEGGDPLKSLAKLANLASQFPDKIFFAAAGNPTDYPLPSILGAKAELINKGKWPSNLFMIGYWGAEYKGEKYPSGYGADYYIKVDDLKRLGLPLGTSFATPVAQRLVANYFSKMGIKPTPSGVREMLDRYSQAEVIGEVWDNATKKPFKEQVLKIIDLDRMVEDFKEGNINRNKKRKAPQRK